MSRSSQTVSPPTTRTFEIARPMLEEMNKEELILMIQRFHVAFDLFYVEVGKDIF